MDDYSINSLIESKNEWCSRLVNILTPPLIEGIKSIFNEACKLCEDNDEEEKYLMTFQTFLSRVPKWNSSIIEVERKRIEENSSCIYLDELIACVHIVHLKALTCVRVGQKQKKIDIDIPGIDDFIHKVYHNVARKIYTNIYLFEKNIQPLTVQKNNRELELIIKECILNTIRENMPIETILKAYIDDRYEEHIEVKEEIIPTYDDIEHIQDIPITSVETKTTTDITTNDTPLDNTIVPTSNTSDNTSEDLTINSNMDIIESNTNLDTQKDTSIKFSDIDNKIDTNGSEESIYVSKNIDDLEKYNETKENFDNMNEDDDENDEDNDVLTIGDDIQLDITDINDLNRSTNINNAPILNDIEILT